LLLAVVVVVELLQVVVAQAVIVLKQGLVCQQVLPLR
jgi:hypothetical protein